MISKAIRPFVVFVFIFSACQNDNKEQLTLNIEEQYFKDYDSPDDKWGYLNNLGDEIIKPRFDDAKDFSEGLAATNLKGKWGFINKSGKSVIPHDYKQLTDFKNGFCFAQNFENKWVLLNNGGKQVSALNYAVFKSYDKGYCPVSNMGLWGIIDTTGAEIVACLYNDILHFNESQFIACQNDRYGILSFEMDTILPFAYDRIWAPVNGFLKVKRDGMISFFKLPQMQNSSPKYLEASQFYEGMSAIKNENGYMLINTEYRSLSNQVYEYLRYGGEGKWQFKRDNQWGLINNDGSKITPARYDIINRFSCARATFRIGENWGYIDDSGNEILPPVLPISWDFKDHYARVIGQYGFGIIDTNIQLIIDDKYKEIRDFHEGLARFQSFD